MGKKGYSQSLRSKDLLGIEELTKEEIWTVLNLAKTFRDVLKRPIPIVPSLRGKTIIGLFFEPSTRTAFSFALAAKRLSADYQSFSLAGSAVLKGETVLDTLKNIGAMRVDGIVIRHQNPGIGQFLSKNLSSFVVNAGDGSREHPTQALLDAYTLLEKKKSLEGKRILIVGDILNSRVARSDLFLFKKLGAEVSLAGPPTLLPPEARSLGAEVYYSIDEILPEFEIIIALRIQLEREKGVKKLPSLWEYREIYGITRDRLKRIREDALICHPGPVNWGVELDFEVSYDKRSVILNQVANGVAVRMAVLFLLAKGEMSL